MNTIDMQKFIFGSLFLIANKLQVIGDQYLEEDGMTTKQWFLTVMLSQFGDNTPTLSEVAELAGSSRQNIKQLSLKLEEKGFLTIEKDDKDARAVRLKLTQKSYEFWEKRSNQDDRYIIELFNDFGEEETVLFYNCINKLYGNILKKDKL